MAETNEVKVLHYSYDGVMKENARLRIALNKIASEKQADENHEYAYIDLNDAIDIAKRALERESK